MYSIPPSPDPAIVVDVPVIKLCVVCAQLLGQLYPQMPGKRQAALAQFQQATQKHTSSGDVWQILAELLAPVDAQGMHLKHPSPTPLLFN